MYIDNRLVYHGYLRRAPLKPAAGAEAVDFGQAILFSDLPHIVRARACARTLGSIAGNHVMLWKPGKESETVRSSTLATQGGVAPKRCLHSSVRLNPNISEGAVSTCARLSAVLFLKAATAFFCFVLFLLEHRVRPRSRRRRAIYIATGAPSPPLPPSSTAPSSLFLARRH